MLDTVGDGRIILGVGDLVMGNNSIERVRWIAERVEDRAGTLERATEEMNEHTEPGD